MHSEESAAQLPSLLIHYLRTPTYHPVAPRYIKTNTRFQMLCRVTARPHFTWSGWRGEAVQLFCRGFAQGRGAGAQFPSAQRWICTERFVLLLGVVIGKSCQSGVGIHKNARQLVMQCVVLRFNVRNTSSANLNVPRSYEWVEEYLMCKFGFCNVVPPKSLITLHLRGRTSPFYLFMLVERCPTSQPKGAGTVLRLPLIKYEKVYSETLLKSLCGRHLQLFQFRTVTPS